MTWNGEAKHVFFLLQSCAREGAIYVQVGVVLKLKTIMFCSLLFLLCCPFAFCDLGGPAGSPPLPPAAPPAAPPPLAQGKMNRCLWVDGVVKE